jgi:MFS family permease
VKALSALTSLLISTVLLLAGHGMQLTLLPLRAANLGHSDLQIAVGASAYFGGFIVGCLLAPRVIARVGHIRSFAVLASAMGSALLVLGLSSHWILWALLRACLGVLICGLYTVIESWLNDQATAENRGQVLSVYTFLVLLAMACGQQLVNAAPIDAATPFMMLAMLMALSVIPVGLTRRLAPAPLESTRSRIFFLFQRAPTAAVVALASGAITGSFWALGAVFARRSFGGLEEATLFMTIAILGGAVCQYGFGWLSDRVGRRLVLLLLGSLGVVSSSAVALAREPDELFTAAFFFGASTMPMYSMALASAADNSLRHEFVEIGTSVLLLNALGAFLAPMLVSQLVMPLGPGGLFWGCAAVSATATLLVAALFWRKPRVKDVVPFAASASEMAPMSFDLDPRAPTEVGGDLVPVEEVPSIEEQVHAGPVSDGAADESAGPPT